MNEKEVKSASMLFLIALALFLALVNYAHGDSFFTTNENGKKKGAYYQLK